MKVIGVAVLKDLDLNLVVDNYATNKTQDPKVAGAPPVAFTCTSSPQKKPKPFIWTQDHRRDPRTLAAYYQRQAERFEMGPTVMLGLELAEATRPVRDGTAADLAARDRKMGNGHGEAAGIGLAHRLHDASPARLALRPPCACRERACMRSWVLA